MCHVKRTLLTEWSTHMSVHHLTFRVNTHNQEYQETQKGMEILRFYDNFHLFDYDTSFVLYSVSYGNTFFK